MCKKIVVISVFFFGLFGFSQQISGKVVDEFNAPLYNVYVYNEVSKTHAHTNYLGEFELASTIDKHSVTFSLLGFKTQTFIVDSKYDAILVVLKDKNIELSELTLTSDLDINSTLSRIDLSLNPVASSQEVLKVVPGLFIGQHAGGGKAEQLFLRGFDIDHGTDIALSVDGFPVNMVSHAHGQGYSDLHFIIPETIESINFDKGPYQYNQGNFATAGYVNFKTKSSLEHNKVSIEAGQFNSLRTFAAFNLLENQSKSTAYVATEYIVTDGPFEAPQNFNRLNVFSKFKTSFSNNLQLTFIASHFNSIWDASGQIPERAVESGLISRFGAIDSTEGGATSRTNAAVNLVKYLDENTSVITNFYFSKYNFKLYSNFTFFLENAIDGDQIKQKENRYLYGFTSDYTKKHTLTNFNVTVNSGIGLKVNTVLNNELSNTKNRTETLNYIQLGNVDEANFFGYYGANFKLNHFSIHPSLRLEYFKFTYLDKLAPTYSNKSTSKVKALPKLTLSYSKNQKSIFFFKTGLGFHSNDSRVVLQEDKEILPTAFGTDLGTILKFSDNFVFTTALWTLFSDQEFVYVGDAGIVEPSGKSKRYGIDMGLKYQLSNYLFLNVDANYSHARSVAEPEGENFIPLAPNFTSVASLSLKNYKNFSATINYKYIADRPAEETNTIKTKGYFVNDLALNYKFNNRFNVGLSVINLFDTKWNETQFLTETRLQNETDSVEEIHFTPGSPFFAKLKLTYTF